MKTAASLLLLVLLLAGCRKNTGTDDTSELGYTVETTPYLQALRLPLDPALTTAVDFRTCRNRDFYDEGGKKRVGYETGSVFYLGFFPNVPPEERVRVLKTWGLFRRTNGSWVQTYDSTAFNQCFFIHAPDSLLTCGQQVAFRNRLLSDPAIKFANPLLLRQPESMDAYRVLDELGGEAASAVTDEQLAEVLNNSNIRFIRHRVPNRRLYTLVVPKGERNALDWAVFLIEKGYFRSLVPPSFFDGRPAGG